jgi:hypothetical protein
MVFLADAGPFRSLGVHSDSMERMVNRGAPPAEVLVESSRRELVKSFD